MEEILKPFRHCPDEFLISNTGRIIRKAWEKLNFNKIDKIKEKDLITTERHNKLTVKVKENTYIVANEVLAHFKNNPTIKMVARHIDGNIYNCSVENLEWVKRPGNQKGKFHFNNIKENNDLVEIELISKKYGIVVTTIDKKNYNRIKNFRWHARGEKPYLYAATYIGHNETGEQWTLLLHRLINSFEGENVDHINGDTLDNREENLRTCTSKQNALNRKKYKNSVYQKGVSKRGKKYLARITINNKTTRIGLFGTEQEASEAYELYAKNLFGEFKREVLNASELSDQTNNQL
jgi:hypothetical protein